MKHFYVYIMTNRSGTLYAGVTNNLERRISEHKTGIVEGFTKRHKIDRLFYAEETTDVIAAISGEKRIKRWIRSKKLDLIKAVNPNLEDLSLAWGLKANKDPSLRSG